MSAEKPSYLVGLAWADMTAFIPGVGMMGYGQFHNHVKEVATPLKARALWIEQKGHPLLWLHLEQAFVTIALKEELLSRLGMPERHVLITAQHTHSAPGGYSHYPFYNFTIGGFQTRVFEKVVSAMVEAAQAARRNLAPAELSWGDVTIPDDVPVAFNRSLRPYLRNPEARPLRPEEKHLAVERRMVGLKITDRDGLLRGFVNWFGVHGTSVSSYNQRIHHDNKGVAAALFERAHPGCVALFVQATAGDVSPNFRWDKKLRRMVGQHDDQYESAAFNGELQFRAAEKIEAPHAVRGALHTHQSYFDMASWAQAPAHGLGFFRGTLEGPGVSETLGDLLGVIGRWVNKRWLERHPEDRSFYDQHSPKNILLDHRNGRFVGIPRGAWNKLPWLPDPTVEAVRSTAAKGALQTLPWIPQIIPFQVIQLGQLLLLCVPGEVTTVAGQRLKAAARAATLGQGVEEILITTYANGYMGYVTTPEEYDLQAYEGGHCVYGRNTLPAIIQCFEVLWQQLRQGQEADSLTAPFHFPPAELARRSV